MPPRPFPFPLRVGTDVCSIARIQNLIASANVTVEGPRLKRFLPKLLTWPEQQYFWHRFEAQAENLTLLSQFLAGRWAAKEACRKACEHLGSSNGFHSIIILPVRNPGSHAAETSRPQALILRHRLPEMPPSSVEGAITRAVDFDMESLDGQMCEVSISHDSEWATAVALVPLVEAWRSEGRDHKERS